METEKTLNILVNLLIFVAGFISCFLFIYSVYSPNLEVPLSSDTSNSVNNAPSDWIKLNQIQVTGDAVIINLPNATLSQYAATGSMKPVFDAGANGIRVVPSSSDQIKIGDIVTYGSESIVHRVIQKGEDSEGIWFLTKGDNNNIDDGEKIRFSDIRYVTVGVLY